MAGTDVSTRSAKTAAIVRRALKALELELAPPGAVMRTPLHVRSYLRLKLLPLEHECFIVLFLNSARGLILAEQMFRGTINQVSVHPREIVKRALALNASAVMFAHNHPTGVAEQSHVDELLTTSLRRALEMVDIQVLDHFIVAGRDIMSFAEKGLL